MSRNENRITFHRICSDCKEIDMKQPILEPGFLGESWELFFSLNNHSTKVTGQTLGACLANAEQWLEGFNAARYESQYDPSPPREQ